MPLMKKKSKKAFEHNVEAEMSAGKPQNQSLAIAYSVKKKAKKASGGTVESGSRDMNMAEGGSVSASNEKRPMPDNRYNDSGSASRNSGNKRPGPDSWTDNPTVAQAQKPSITKLSRPRMVPSSVINARLITDEDDLQSAMPPSSDKDQPGKWMNESDAKKMGAASDMADEHSTKSRPYNKAIEDQYAQDVAATNMKKEQSYAEGGEVESSDYDHPLGGRYEDDLLDLGPSEDEGTASARSKNESGPNRQGPMTPDLNLKMMADGGIVDDSHETDIMEAASIAAAIMAKRKMQRENGMSGSKDMNAAEMYAEGGMVDLSTNHDEEPNNEDQMSFEALKKENYNSSNLDVENPEDSAQTGDQREDAEENDHDASITSKIRSKMKKRSPISR